MEKNEYDINNYTDQECFDILDLDNPTDRELEMKILQFMDKYEEKSKRLYSFLNQCMTVFFWMMMWLKDLKVLILPEMTELTH
jgi:hypothetical protein